MMDVETIARTVAELVRSLAGEGRDRAAQIVLADGDEKAVRVGLERAGWRIAEPGEAAELSLTYCPDRERVEVTGDQIALGAQILVVGTSLGRLSPGLSETRRRGFFVIETLNEWIAQSCGAERSGGQRLAGTLYRCWTKSFLARSIGGKTVKRRVPRVWVWKLVREDATDPHKPVRRPGDRVRLAAATVFGLGYIPYFPGTWGALAGLFCALGLSAAAGGCFLLFWALCAGATAGTALWCLAAEPWFKRHFGRADPREVVLDEVAGMLAACLFFPTDLFERSWLAQAALWCIAFAGFRVFDILKLGVRWLERREWRGAIVGDDLLAGIYAGLAVLAVSWWLR